MPFSPPKVLSLVNNSSGDNFFPSIDTGSPFSNSISIYVALSGASSGETVL